MPELEYLHFLRWYRTYCHVSKKSPSFNMLKIVQKSYFKTKNHDLTSLFKKLSDFKN